jgi:hypothetical protein
VADDKYKEKKYRRPDGSTYMQAMGPRSERDVEVKGASTSTSTPATGTTPARQTSRATSGRTNTEVAEINAQAKADEATARAKHTDVIAPWVGKKIEQQEGGLGGRAKREAEVARKKQKDSDLPADKAGDAIAEDAEKKKKKNPNGGY